MLRSMHVLLIVSGMGFAFACADEGAERGVAPTSTTSSAGTHAGKSRGGAPEIGDLQLRPEIPVPGQVIRAVARLVDTSAAIGAELEYEWTVNGDSNYPNTKAIELPDLDRGSRVSVSVVARNGEAASASRVATGVVANISPRITGLEVREMGGTEAAQGWRAEVRAEDSNGDEIEVRYKWFINDRASAQRTASFSTEDLKRGDRVYVEVVAHDDADASRPLRSGVLEIANAAPDITSVPTGLNSAGTFAYQIEVEDADGDMDMSFVLDVGPSGMRLSPDGTLRWEPDIDQVGDHQVIVSVSDNRGGQATQEFVLPVRAKRVSDSTSPAAID